MAANPSIQLGTDGNWAIKEDNLLAYKKDGTRFFNKEFDFTRGSLATFVDKDGLIKVSGVIDTELVVNGDFDTDSNWTKGTGWSISGGTANCDGTQVANSLIYQSSVLVSANSFKCEITISDYQSGVLRLVLGGGGSEQSYSASGTYTFYGTKGSDNNLYLSANSDFIGSIDNISVVEIQTDVPRIDFTDDVTGHLLLEPQSTNLLPYSEDFTKWTLGSNSILTYESDVVAPDGSLGVYKLTNPATSSTFIQSTSFSSSNPLTVSLYVKSTGSGNDNFNFYTGASNVSDLKTATSEWQRFDYTADGSSMYIINSGDTFTSDIYIWGAQAETLSYPTSYIPTYGSTATRNGEVCNNSGSEQDFNDSEGVLYVEMSALNNGGIQTGVRLQNDSEDSVLTIYYNLAANYLTPRLYKSNSSIWARDIVIGDQTVNNKFALRYNSNGADIFINGLKNNCSSLNSSFTNGTITNFSFIGNNGSGNPLYGKTKNLKVFKRAMSDGELYLLTVPQYQSYQEMATALNYTL